MANTINKIKLPGNDKVYSLEDITKIPSAEKGANGGVATLDSNGKVPASQLPSFVNDVKVNNGESVVDDNGVANIPVVPVELREIDDDTLGVGLGGATELGIMGIDINNQSILIDEGKKAQIKLKTVNGNSIVGEGDIAGGLVDDVQVNGVSIVEDKVANFKNLCFYEVIEK